MATAGIEDGDWVYLSAAGVATKADAASEITAEVVGASEGIDGEIRCAGVIQNAKFTTDGGEPADGHKVFLALASADAGTGDGKLTATEPNQPGQVRLCIGKCLDKTNYAGLRTSKVLFQMGEPIVLS